MKGRSNDYLWGQTDRLLSLICLPCSKKCCFVGLGWFCFAWLFPSDAFSLLSRGAGMFSGHAGSRVSALPSLANLPSLVLWTGFYWPFKMHVHLYKHNQQIAETCKQNLPGPFLEPKAGREKLSGPRVSVGHRALAWQQLRCSLTRDNSVPPLLPYQAIQTHLAVTEIRG